MSILYPLKFQPIYKHYVWGGKKLAKLKNIKLKNNETISESWELSSVSDNISVVSNGFLAGNSLQEVLEIYMGDLVGESVYEKYGIEFPVLLKFIDAEQSLSVQVHPDDEIALQRHNAYGKEEMWYILEAEKDAEVCIGFNQKTDKKSFEKYLKDKALLDLLNFEKIKNGDVFEVPSGRIHAIKQGTLLAEIQNTSDITYRVYDWEREYDSEKAREMHIDLALDVIDYNNYKSYKTDYSLIKNNRSELCKNEHFKVNIIDFDNAVICDYSAIDSFVAYMCVCGDAILECGKHKETITKGETILVPAAIDEIKLIPNSHTRLLEISM